MKNNEEWSYKDPKTKAGVIGKTVLQILDPTGISGWQDAGISIGNAWNNPSWSNVGEATLNTISALPVIGKVTAPIKFIKGVSVVNKIGNKINKVNKAIDTVPELLHIKPLSWLTEKTQNVTSKLISPTIHKIGKTYPKYSSKQEKFYEMINNNITGLNFINSGLDVKDLLNVKDKPWLSNKELVSESDKPKTFEEYYKYVPKEKNDTINYDLRRAFKLAPYKDLVKFAEQKEAHLNSVYRNPATDIYEFVKSKNHPTVKLELDWYNSPDANEFKKTHRIDSTSDKKYYKYVPIKK